MDPPKFRKKHEARMKTKDKKNIYSQKHIRIRSQLTQTHQTPSKSQ